MNENKIYEWCENPMVLPEYKYKLDFDDEKYSYLEDMAWNDKKDKDLGI